MKAITILQPWASLTACGAKKIETRSWATKYRGPIAIHAGKALPSNDRQIIADTLYEKNEFNLPLGAVIAITDLIACEEMTMDKIVLWRDVYGKEEIEFGDYSPGRYAWILTNVRRIDPIPARGMQRIWKWEGYNA